MGECFPVTEYLEDEMRERGLTYDSLAAAMPGNPRFTRLQFDVLRSAVGGKDTRVLLGDLAEGLEQVLGIEAGFWVRLHNAWRECVRKERTDG